MSFIFPPLLQAGDRVRIVAPSGKLGERSVTEAFELLVQHGLHPEPGQYLHAAHGSFAGTDQQRLRDLQEAIDDPNIRAILCARGGYGITRYLDKLDLQPLHRHPKWIVGYSDITALLLQLEKEGLACVHGLLGAQFGAEGAAGSATALLAFLRSGQLPVLTATPTAYNRQGNTSGSLFGGNLALLAAIAGTATQPAVAGKILFLEEIGEPLYAIDRMMTQLQRAGMLTGVAGIVCGQFSHINQNEGNPFLESYQEIILRHAPAGVPVAFGFDFGHDLPNMPLVLGATAELVVGEGGAELVQSWYKILLESGFTG